MLFMGTLSLVGVLKAKAFAIIYRFLWLTHLERLFELKTCSEFNLNSLIYLNFDSGGGFKGKSICHHLPVPVVASFCTSF
jgi:predicted outer membrane lipoprotein